MDVVHNLVNLYVAEWMVFLLRVVKNLTPTFLFEIAGRGINRVLNSTDYYDDVSDKWIRSTPMLQKKLEDSPVALRDKIYFIGGSNRHEGPLNTAEIFRTKMLIKINIIKKLSCL